MHRYKVGDKVRIVSNRPSSNWVSSMDKHLGTIMTIKSISGNPQPDRGYSMVEDKDGFTWGPIMFAGLYEDTSRYISDEL